jgi:hypothetical protein
LGGEDELEVAMRRILDNTAQNVSRILINAAQADSAALRDINDLVARGVLRKLEGDGRSTVYLLVKQGCSPRGICASSYQY